MEKKLEYKLSLVPAKKAISSLNKALEQPKNEFTRDAAIQRFEYSFELCWKLLKRYFNLSTGLEEFQIKNIFREAAKQGLINNLDNWFSYHTARNLTAHTYNEQTAEETFQAAKKFAIDANLLLQNLEKALGNSIRKS